jgi:hypothetical protein
MTCFRTSREIKVFDNFMTLVLLSGSKTFNEFLSRHALHPHSRLDPHYSFAPYRSSQQNQSYMSQLVVTQIFRVVKCKN